MKPTPLLLCAALALVPTALHAAPAKHPPKAAPAPPAVAPALKAALAWLALVDGSHYDQSWTAAAPAFQAQVTQAQWTDAMTQVRAPLGAVKTRTFASVKYAKTLPGAPDGDYAILQYSTAFTAKPSVETIVMLKGTDGQWRTDGYFIR